MLLFPSEGSLSPLSNTCTMLGNYAELKEKLTDSSQKRLKR